MHNNPNAMRFVLIFLFSFIAFTEGDNNVAVEMSAMELNYRVDAYECDSNLQELSDKQVKNIGQSYRVCFRPNSIASEANVRIAQINSWKWTFDDQVQHAVIDGKGVGGVTLVQCQEGGEVCSMDSMLVTSFFENPGTVVGEGTVSFTSGTGTVPATFALFSFKFNFQMLDDDGKKMEPAAVSKLLKSVGEHNEAVIKAKTDEKPRNEEL